MTSLWYEIAEMSCKHIPDHSMSLEYHYYGMAWSVGTAKRDDLGVANTHQIIEYVDLRVGTPRYLQG